MIVISKLLLIGLVLAKKIVSPEHMREQVLVKRAKTDEAAFTELYDFYLPKIYGFVLKRVRQREAAEDLVSDIFMRAFANLDKYEDRGYTFGAWLYRIASNALVDYYRRQASRKEVELEQAHAVIDENDAGKGIEELENRKTIEKCLAGLSDRERKIVELKFYGELSNIEIAEAVEVSVSNVGVIVYRALKKMKEVA